MKARRKLLINRKFQLSFLNYTCGIASIVFSVFFIANEYFFWKFNKYGISLGLPKTHFYFTLLTEQEKTMALVFTVSIIFIFAVLIFFGLYYSNKIAGPIRHLEYFLKKKAQEADNSHIKFRSKDYFHELEEPINQLIDRASK
ncbi:MAG: hypothetical protein JWQ35_85 [Bacteriovoracaceae bacterium]|nr:hypothetical protein [Bacteriovoracaceae bacterium]